MLHAEHCWRGAATAGDALLLCHVLGGCLPSDCHTVVKGLLWSKSGALSISLLCWNSRSTQALTASFSTKSPCLDPNTTSLPCLPCPPTNCFSFPRGCYFSTSFHDYFSSHPSFLLAFPPPGAPFHRVQRSGQQLPPSQLPAEQSLAFAFFAIEIQQLNFHIIHTLFKMPIFERVW